MHLTRSAELRRADGGAAAFRSESPMLSRCLPNRLLPPMRRPKSTAMQWSFRVILESLGFRLWNLPPIASWVVALRGKMLESFSVGESSVVLAFVHVVRA